MTQRRFSLLVSAIGTDCANQEPEAMLAANAQYLNMKLH
jgi:hypothetical protein